MSINNIGFKINNRVVGIEHPTYFIADIAANHDGDLEKAKDLIYLAAESGAHAVKFQHFLAETIISDTQFNRLRNNSHQSSWNDSVFNVYKKYSLNIEWTSQLRDTSIKAGVDFMTTPYDITMLDELDKYVSCYKIGSGDITYHPLINSILLKNKPIMIATGASSFEDVNDAMSLIMGRTKEIVLMQCNTNYTASLDNYNFINLNVLKLYAKTFPNSILGLSDHTPGCATVLGAITLGARVIEKHFTDNNNLDGPDHLFSMNPESWKEMVERAYELQSALGDGIKRIEENEVNSAVVQRRSMYVTRDMEKGSQLSDDDLIALRPCPSNGISPKHYSEILGKSLTSNLASGSLLRWSDLK